METKAIFRAEGEGAIEPMAFHGITLPNRLASKNRHHHHISKTGQNLGDRLDFLPAQHAAARASGLIQIVK